MQNKKFDIAIIGSGLSGLVCANILSKEGLKVIVIEKNKQIGGNLQTFSKDKVIFDTGVHYVGSLGKGETLNQIFDYLGIMKDLKIKKMDEIFDVISFDNDENEYPFSQGNENFINNLLHLFPDEKEALEKYLLLINNYLEEFPFHKLDLKEINLKEEIINTKAYDLINSVTENEKLKSVLAGINFLYAGMKNVTPFYVHVLSISSYLKSSWKFINGGSQISKLLSLEIKKNGGKIIKNSEIININVEEKFIKYIETKDSKIYADKYISAIDLKRTLSLIDNGIRKSYKNRINEKSDTLSCFSVYITLKPNTFKNKNKNYYHFKDFTKVWDCTNYSIDNWPENYIISFNGDNFDEKYAKGISILTYMKYEEVKEWETTFNTTSLKKSRGYEYEEFKKHKAEKLITEVEKKFPDIRNCIKNIYISTPLTYRDYIGNSQGSMYGIAKEVNNSFENFLMHKTRIKNLHLTGQSVFMHGIFGVTIGAIYTCSDILGKEYIVNKIKSKNIKS